MKWGASFDDHHFFYSHRDGSIVWVILFSCFLHLLFFSLLISLKSSHHAFPRSYPVSLVSLDFAQSAKRSLTPTAPSPQVTQKTDPQIESVATEPPSPPAIKTSSLPPAPPAIKAPSLPPAPLVGITPISKETLTKLEPVAPPQVEAPPKPPSPPLEEKEADVAKVIDPAPVAPSHDTVEAAGRGRQVTAAITPVAGLPGGTKGKGSRESPLSN